MGNWWRMKMWCVFLSLLRQMCVFLCVFHWIAWKAVWSTSSSCTANDGKLTLISLLWCARFPRGPCWQTETVQTLHCGILRQLWCIQVNLYTVFILSDFLDFNIKEGQFSTFPYLKISSQLNVKCIFSTLLNEVANIRQVHVQYRIQAFAFLLQ